MTLLVLCNSCEIGSLELLHLLVMMQLLRGGSFVFNMICFTISNVQKGLRTYLIVVAEIYRLNVGWLTYEFDLGLNITLKTTHLAFV